MLGPLASARFDPELHSGGRPEAAAAAESPGPDPRPAAMPGAMPAGVSNAAIRRRGPVATLQA